METTLTTPFPVLAMASWAAALALILIPRLRRTAATRSTMDGPQLLLAGAARLLPERRHDWGTAMAAELAHIQGRKSRWGFAIGCARVALLPPNNSRAPVVATIGASAIATVLSGVVVGRVLPAMQVFAVTFAALVGVVATLTVGRVRRPNLAVPGLAATVAMLSGVACCVAIFAYVAVRYPSAVHDPTHGFSILFALTLTLYVWLALAPPRVLTTNRVARRIGVGAAVVIFGLGYAFIAANSYDGQLFYLLAGLFVAIPAVAVAAATIGGRRRDGAEAAVWMGLVSGLLIFAVNTIVPILGLQLDAAFLDDGYPPGVRPDLGVWLPEMLGGEIGGGIFALLLLPGWALFFGLMGGAVGAAAREGFDEPLTRKA